MGSAFLYVLGGGFAGGIAAATLLPLSFPIVSFLLLLAVGLLALVGRGSGASATTALTLISVCLFASALGATRLLFEEATTPISPYDAVLGTKTTIVGMVIREPDLRERTTNLTVETEAGRVLVRGDRHVAVAYGDTITATGTIERPESFTTEFGRTFNYPGYLTAQGIAHTMSFAEVSVIETGGGMTYLRFLYGIKHRFMAVIESLIPEPEAGLSEGLLLGVKQALGDELESAFRTTGIIHIVVLSGYNIMLVVTFVTYLSAFVLPFRARLIFGLAAIVSFALLVGLSATVVRASIMASLLLIVRTFGRTYLIVRALILAAMVMLLVNPYLLVYDVGFQLSFMATLGLILLAPALEARLGYVPSLIGLRGFLTATIVTQFFVSPLLLYQIGQFSVVAIIVNVLVLPMVPVAMLLTFLTGLLGFISLSLAAPVAIAAHLSLQYIIVIALFFSSVPFASLVVPAFSVWYVACSYVLMGALLWWRSEAVTVPSVPAAATAWVIEEEAEVLARLKTGGSEAAASDPPVTPSVFFK